MHHLVIGEFVFSVGDKTPISKIERISNGAYSEVSMIDGAIAEFTGRPLDSIDISAKWTRYGATKNAASLRDLLLEPQQVSDGQGFNLGKWTIKQIKEGRSELVHDGRAMVTEVSLQLMEFR